MTPFDAGMATGMATGMDTGVAAGVAAGLAALAVAMALPAAGRLPLEPRRLRRAPGRLLQLVFVGLGAVLLAVLEGRDLALGLIGLATAGGIVVQVRRARRWRAAQQRQHHVVEVCEALVGELRAGQPLVTSLEHSAEVWPEFGPAVSAARLGADVPAALGRLAARPGAEGLRDVASAWRVSQRSGAGLAAALGQVAGTARERQATRHLVHGELASAQATARLVALLPFASLAMAAGIGGDPWHFLLRTSAGLACLATGLGFAFAGLAWIDRIAAAVLEGR